MIRIARLRRVAGGRPHLDGEIAPGLRVEVRRADDDPEAWLLLASCKLVAVPPAIGAGSSRISVRSTSEAERARKAARDAIERHGDGALDDPLPDWSGPT